MKLPWWKVFVSGLGNFVADAESDLSSNVTIMANAKVDANADARVRLVEAIVTSLTKVESAVKASYDVKASVK